MIVPITLPLALQALRLHDIDCGVQSCINCGWHAWIGSEISSARAEEMFDGDEFEEIAPWLVRTAQKLYPSLGMTH